MVDKKVEALCGPYPENFIKKDILSNPDFVFINDPNYYTRILQDYDENFVSVNSFTECEHYVVGGWDYMPKVVTETTFHTRISVSILLIILFQYTIKVVKTKLIK